MFAKRIPLFTMFGFQVRADTSWFIILAFLIWVLAAGYFPAQYEDLTAMSYLVLGIGGALGLFLSIIIHEFCHAWVAQRQGLPMSGITLWIFGGIAEMSADPQSAKQEFLMAAAGPAASVVLAGVFYGLAAVAPTDSPFVQGILSYLWKINLILAAFNLIPAFPLDGGRILRSILWRWKGRIRWATRIASNIGSGFGFVLMIVGALGFLGGNLVGGVWYFFIGLFVRWAAKMSYVRLRINQALGEEPISKLMKETHPIPEQLSLNEAIQDYMYRYRAFSLPVVNSAGMAVGTLTSKAIKDVSADARSQMRVSEIMDPIRAENSIDADEAAKDLLQKMTAEASRPIIVVKDGKPVGSLAQSDILQYVALKLELSGEEDDISPDMRFSRAG